MINALRDCGMLVLGRQIDGAWALVEGGGALIGRFPTYDAALRQVADEHRKCPELPIASSRGSVGLGANDEA